MQENRFSLTRVFPYKDISRIFYAVIEQQATNFLLNLNEYNIK